MAYRPTKDKGILDQIREGRKEKVEREVEREEISEELYLIAEKILEGQSITEEEKVILRPVQSQVAMALAARACRGIVGKTTMKQRRWDKEKKEFGPEEERTVSIFEVCVAHNMMRISSILSNALRT